MKRLLCVLLAVLMAAAAAGCTDTPQPQTPEHPFLFYYERVEVLYDSDSGVIGAEERDFDPKTADAAALLEEYFKGAVSQELILPFPEDTCAVNCDVDGGTVFLTLNSGYSRLSGISKSVAEACLAKTLLQLPQVERVCIRSLSGENTWLRRGDMILRDDSAQVQDTTVKLYFADADNRYLVAEQRSAGSTADKALPEFIVRQLMAGTRQRGLHGIVPKDAGLRSIRVSEGVCIVDFTVEFLTDKPTSYLEERMLVYSIVNSLTELESIDAVELRADGESIGRYVQMDLMESLTRNEAVIGPVKTASGEVDATLFARSENSALLFGIPTRVTVPEGQTVERAVLDALVQMSVQPMYVSAVPVETGINSVTVEEGICHIDFDRTFLSGCADEAALTAAVKCVVATMTEIGDIAAVSITVAGEPLPEGLNGALAPEAEWFAEEPALS